MQRAEDVLPEFGIHVQKTQITLLNRHAFACVSPPAVRRKARIPQSSITLTSGLDHPLASARIVAKSEAYPGRWTHHLLISDAAELDSELFAWLHEACELAARKQRGAPGEKADSLLAAAHEDGRQPGQSKKPEPQQSDSAAVSSQAARRASIRCLVASIRESACAPAPCCHAAWLPIRCCVPESTVRFIRRATPLGAADS
jgi:hypothetical protein